MSLSEITPLIITYNEAPNIRRSLNKLNWANRIVVIDSGSTDGTIEILQSFSNINVVYHPFLDFADQCNFGLSVVATSWVLSLDADYELSDELLAELPKLALQDAAAGYRANFIYRIYGRRLRSSLYPPRTVLYRKAAAMYKNEGHGHRVSISGIVWPLHGPIYHDDRKPLAQWFASQQRYAKKEASHLLSSADSELSRVDRLRRAGWPAPIAVFFYVLLVKGCVLDGWPGWFYVLQRVLAEICISLEIIDQRLKKKEGP